MLRTMQTAVAAVVSRTRGQRVASALGAAEIELEFLARDGNGAREALLRFRSDLLVTDAQLPETDGAALAARILGGFEFPVRPAVILLGESWEPVPESAVVLPASFTEEELVRAVDRLRRAPAAFSAEESVRAEALLEELGVPEHVGRDCLKTACLLCASDERLRSGMRGALYPRVGEIYGLTAAQAERAMRHGIALAWQSDKIENQYRIFRDTIDAGRGQPTCREMISRLADILRLEG